jgi:Ca2+-binding EF-hand superfamily protein
MRKFFAGMLAAAAWSFAPPGIQAQDAELFDRLDANKDGFITPDEAGGEEKKRLFERLLRTVDKNKDGKLSREEFAEGIKTREEAPREERAGIPTLAQVLERFDKNGDGKLSKEEAPERMKENFDRLDANKDGVLDKEELGRSLALFGGPAGGQAFYEEMFKRQDANKDGKLTADEVPEERREQFTAMLKRLGKEKEGVTLEEFVRFVSQRPGGPGQPPPQYPPGGTFGLYAAGPLLRALDTDQDGELSAAEIAAAPKTLLTLDKNGDGKLTREELIPQPPAVGIPGLPVQGNFFERLREADKDGDGKLSKEEAPPFLRERFDQLDANKDGFLDKDELQKAFPRPLDRRPDGERRPEPEKPKPDAK